MNMIEKVARAICRAGICGPKEHLDEQENAHWRSHEHLARAAIEAMRELPDEMKQAAARGVSDSFHEEGYNPEYDPPELWNEFVKAGERAWENAINIALNQK